MWRKARGTPGSAPSLTKQKSEMAMASSNLESTMTLSLNDLPECPQKETVMVVWGSLLKSVESAREALDAEGTKRSQLEMQLQEERALKDTHVQTIEVLKREMRELFDVACAVAQSEEGQAKLRRK